MRGKIYSRSQVKKAGTILKNKESNTPEEIAYAEDILTYWRTIHGVVLQEFYKIVNSEVEKIDKNAYVVQRLKRSPSIIDKLKRLSATKLTTMQDIAGIRAIMKDLNDVEILRGNLLKYKGIHEFVNCKDYILNPKDSGYRSIHLIYKFLDIDIPEYNGLQIEIQIRTDLQHSWATAVETMSTFLGTNLKTGKGQPKWKKYFALTSSAFSFLENTPQVPNYENMSKVETFNSAVYEYNYNKIEPKLSAFAVAAEHIINVRSNSDIYHLLKLDIEKRKVRIESYPIEKLNEANNDYTKLEREFSKSEKFQVVLVSTDSIKELKDAYPNYFLDTKDFIKNMDVIKSEKIRMANEKI